jgi:hypothetical protein
LIIIGYLLYYVSIKRKETAPDRNVTCRPIYLLNILPLKKTAGSPEPGGKDVRLGWKETPLPDPRPAGWKEQGRPSGLTKKEAKPDQSPAEILGAGISLQLFLSLHYTI